MQCHDQLIVESTNDTSVCCKNYVFFANTLVYSSVNNASQLSLKPLKDTFDNKLVKSMTPLIKNTVSSPNKLFELKSFIKRAYVEMKPKLSHAETVDDVLRLVIERCSLINVSCLESVIGYCDIKPAKEELSQYMKRVDEFCEATTVSQCVNETFRLSSSQLLSCDTVQFALRIDDCSLSELRRLKKRLFGQFADRVLIHSIEYKDCVTVKCFAPQHIRDCLIAESEGSSILVRGEIQMLRIGSNVLWDYEITDEDDVQVSITNLK